MASRIIQSPDPGPDLGQSQDSGQDFGPYLPDVTAVRGSNSIEQIATVGVNLLTLIEVVIDGDLQFWQLQEGTATADTENTVAPLDNPTDVHWQRVGGFGIAMMAAARVTTAASVSISNNVLTTITFDTERFNSGEWSLGTNPSRITALVDGVYSISGSVSFAPNDTGQRKLSIRKSGSLEIASEQVLTASSSLPTNLTVSTITALSAGEYVELSVLQNTGGSLDVLKADQYSPEFSVVRLSAFSDLPVFSGNPPNPFSDPPPNPFGDPPPSVPPGVSDTKKTFNITDIGWYQLWSGSYPASTSFNIKRSDNGDGQTSDTLIDATIIADSPEGIINVGRNSVPNPDSPSIDAVRVYHDASALLAYVEVHLIRAGEWTLQYTSSDENFLDAPFLNSFGTASNPVLTYQLKANVTGGTGTIDVPQINSGGSKILIPPNDVNPWAEPTGTTSRSSYDSDSATLDQVAQRLKAVIDDLVYAGVFRVGIPTSMTYADMISLSASLVFENAVANLTNIFRVDTAPDTSVQGVYVPVGTFNGHVFYKLQGYEYEAASQGGARQCYWSSEWNTWTISNASGNVYHSSSTETHPWDVTQWNNQSPSNVTVTTDSPNVSFTYNLLTDTHTAMIVTGSTIGYNGLYLRVADVDSKRSYKLVGTGTNNKRIEHASLFGWTAKDDSATSYTGGGSETYPDEVASWDGFGGGNTDVITVTGINASDLMSGVTLAGGDGVSDIYAGIYLPVQGVYDVLSTHKLVYRRSDGTYFMVADDSTPCWVITDANWTPVSLSDTSLGNFPWNVPWTAIVMTAQQNKVASPGFNNLYTYNSSGNWHL